MTREEFLAANQFGNIVRIPSPLPFEIGGTKAVYIYLLLPPEGSDELVLIDTGIKSDASLKMMEEVLSLLGYSWKNIQHILLTHAHMDHYGLAKILRERSGATLYSGGIEAGRMNSLWSKRTSRDDYYLPWFSRWGVPLEKMERERKQSRLARIFYDDVDVDVQIDEGPIEIAGHRLQAVLTPGHCAGHMVFYQPKSQTLFSGDHLLTEITPVPLLVLTEPPERRPKSVIRFLDSLDKVDSLDCRSVFPAHGDVIADHRKLTRQYREHHIRRKWQFAAFLEEKAFSPYALACQMFQKYLQSRISQTFLILSETIGHLDLLEQDGHVRIEEEAGLENVILTPAGREALRGWNEE